MISRTLLTMVLLLGLTVFSGNEAHAYYRDEVKNLEQSHMTVNSATIKWDRLATAASYQVVFNNATLATIQGTSYTITGLERGSSQLVYVYPVNASGERGWSERVRIKTTPNNVGNFHVSDKSFYSQKIRLSWNVAAPKPDRYEVTIYNSNNKLVSSHNVGTNLGYILGIKYKERESYTYKIRAYNELGTKRYYSDYSTTAFIPPFEVTRARVSGKKLQIAWRKVSGATGYDIYVSNKEKSGYRKVKSVGKNATKFTLKRYRKKAINRKKNYYVQVVAKRRIGNQNIRSEKFYYRGTKGGLKRF